MKKSYELKSSSIFFLIFVIAGFSACKTRQQDPESSASAFGMGVSELSVDSDFQVGECFADGETGTPCPHFKEISKAKCEAIGLDEDYVTKACASAGAAKASCLDAIKQPTAAADRAMAISKVTGQLYGKCIDEFRMRVDIQDKESFCKRRLQFTKISGRDTNFITEQKPDVKKAFCHFKATVIFDRSRTPYCDPKVVSRSTVCCDAGDKNCAR